MRLERLLGVLCLHSMPHPPPPPPPPSSSLCLVQAMQEELDDLHARLDDSLAHLDAACVQTALQKEEIARLSPMEREVLALRASSRATEIDLADMKLANDELARQMLSFAVEDRETKEELSLAKALGEQLELALKQLEGVVEEQERAAGRHDEEYEALRQQHGSLLRQHGEALEDHQNETGLLNALVSTHTQGIPPPPSLCFPCR